MRVEAWVCSEACSRLVAVGRSVRHKLRSLTVALDFLRTLNLSVRSRICRDLLLMRWTSRYVTDKRYPLTQVLAKAFPSEERGLRRARLNEGEVRGTDYRNEIVSEQLCGTQRTSRG
jgi:hypothetical protein